ncbi:carbohydrate-binding family 9-like protein, partial [bacterium]|nr:carbohydrate-binding family 9-like protein [bacterium]
MLATTGTSQERVDARAHLCSPTFSVNVGLLALLVVSTCAHAESPVAAAYIFPAPAIECSPETYVCQRARTPLEIDGVLDEESWAKAARTELFVDIRGREWPVPRFGTRAAMLWDDEYFYVAAWMEEPHVWASLTERDAVIFYDNDFEVFIDPDGDTHEYYELEVNAFETEWDLLLTKPYRDGGTAIDSWDIQGLPTGVHVDGTLNDPSDQDIGWTVEIAIPWKVLEECAHGPCPPEQGDSWRINFSRVEWRTDAVAGFYEKSVDGETGKSWPEDNWVWSPQGLIAMHYPEMWGVVAFSASPVGEQDEPAPLPDDLWARSALMKLYYAERTFHGRHGRYSGDLAELGLEIPPVKGVAWPPSVHVTPWTF